VRPRGSVNPLSVVIIVAAIAGLYWAILYVPMYVDNLSVREAADVGITASKADDERVIEAVLRRINFGQEAVGTHMEEDANGDLVEKRGLGLTAENVTVDRNEQAKTIRVVIDYTREIHLKPSSKVRTVSFHVEKEGPISQ
jgi:hypothetical protein